jgi:hypothetical protein
MEMVAVAAPPLEPNDQVDPCLISDVRLASGLGMYGAAQVGA